MVKFKKKGFTLIELIAAIGILASIITTVTFCVSTSTNMYRVENIKFKCISAANSILGQLQAKGTDTSSKGSTNRITSLEDFFPSDTAVDTDRYNNCYKYIFFNYEDLKTILSNYNDFIETTNSQGYSNFKGIKPVGKTYVAYITIQRFKNTAERGTQADGTLNDQPNFDWYYFDYKVTVKVWNLDEDNANYSSEITTELKR